MKLTAAVLALTLASQASTAPDPQTLKAVKAAQLWELKAKKRQNRIDELEALRRVDLRLHREQQAITSSQTAALHKIIKVQSEELEARSSGVWIPWVAVGAAVLGFVGGALVTLEIAKARLE